MNLGRKLFMRERRKTRYVNGATTIGKRTNGIRGRAITWILWACVVFVFASTVFEFGSIWRHYGVFFGPSSEAQQFVDRQFISYELDTRSSLLALKQLQVACLKYEIKNISFEELSSQLGQVRSLLQHYEGETLIANEMLRYETFNPAMERVKRFLDIAQQYQEGHASIGDVLLVSDDALEAWMRLCTDTIKIEIQMRDSTKVAIEDFGRLAKQTGLVVGLLSGLTMLLLIALAYFARMNASRERNRFRTFETLVASVVHDLASPLQAIHSTISLLSNELPTADRRRYLTVARTAANSISRLVMDIFQITRGEPLTIELKNVNIQTWFNNFVSLYESKARNKGLEFMANIETHSTQFSLDPDRLTQCIGNLLDNAIRYTKNGKVGVSLTVRDQTRGGHGKLLVIKVKDTGIGIAQVDMNRIFLPFERATEMESLHGMGLGLSIVKNMVEGSGGYIDVESEVGVGSVFTFILPVEEVSNTTVPWGENATIPQKLTSGTPDYTVIERAESDRSPAVKCDILVAGDASNELSSLLEDAGLDVDTAVNFTDAMKLLSKTCYKVVCVVNQLPGSEEFELAQECKKMKFAPHTFAVTSAASDLRKDSRSKCYDEVFTYPVENEIESFLIAIDAGVKERAVG